MGHASAQVGSLERFATSASMARILIATFRNPAQVNVLVKAPAMTGLELVHVTRPGDSLEWLVMPVCSPVTPTPSVIPDRRVLFRVQVTEIATETREFALAVRDMRAQGAIPVLPLTMATRTATCLCSVLQSALVRGRVMG